MSSVSSNPDYERLFKYIDTDNNHTISKVELNRALKTKGLPESLISRLFSDLDIDHDGKITKVEYYSRLEKMKPADRAIFQWFLVFERFDKDKSGFLDKQEFAAALRASGIMANQQESEHYFRKFDTNHDGKINFKEFLDWKVSEMDED